eukprot:1148839-Pelagomonas_calceolata.AAC.1
MAGALMLLAPACLPLAASMMHTAGSSIYCWGLSNVGAASPSPNDTCWYRRRYVDLKRPPAPQTGCTSPASSPTAWGSFLGLTEHAPGPRDSWPGVVESGLVANEPGTEGVGVFEVHERSRPAQSTHSIDSSSSSSSRAGKVIGVAYRGVSYDKRGSSRMSDHCAEFLTASVREREKCTQGAAADVFCAC